MSIKQILYLIILITFLQTQITPIIAVTGTVKFFNRVKSFGFIAGDDGKDYFVHMGGLMPNVTITEGDKVCFDVVESEKGPKADIVYPCNESSIQNVEIVQSNRTLNETLINQSNRSSIKRVMTSKLNQNREFRKTYLNQKLYIVLVVYNMT